jgi:hypothetical protein
MKKLLLIISLLFLTYYHSDCQSGNPKYELWKKPGFFRGFNVLSDNVICLKDFQDLKALGATLVQLEIIGFNEVEKPYKIRQNQIQLTDKLVSYCRSVRIYYTIALRDGPGRRDVSEESDQGLPRSTIWKNKDEQKLYASMIKAIAQRYMNDTLFVGLGPIVEPNPMFDQPPFSPQIFKAMLTADSICPKDINRLIIDSVRTASDKLPLILQNVVYSCPEFYSIMDKQDDPYIVYEFHSYRPTEYVKSNDDDSKSYPESYLAYPDLKTKYYDRAFFRDYVFKTVRDYGFATGSPIFLGEYGLMKHQNNGKQFLKDVSYSALEFGFHIALWRWRGNNEKGAWNYESMGNDYINTIKDIFKEIVADIENQDMKNIDDILNIYTNITQDIVYIEYKYMEGASLKIYDIYGNEIRDLGNRVLPESSNKIFFQTDNLASGIYLINYRNGKVSQTKTVIILR